MNRQDISNFHLKTSNIKIRFNFAFSSHSVSRNKKYQKNSIKCKTPDLQSINQADLVLNQKKKTFAVTCPAKSI